MIFLAKSRNFDNFGVPGMSLGEALRKILGRKYQDEKKTKKKVHKPVASAGDADPGQDPPAGFLKHDLTRLRLTGGWSDCSGRAETPPAPKIRTFN